MKSNNQNEQLLFQSAITSAANEDGFASEKAREAAAPASKQAWSPYEVWRTRVKADPRHRPEPAQI